MTNKHLLASWSLALTCKPNLQLPWIVTPNKEMLLYCLILWDYLRCYCAKMVTLLLSYISNFKSVCNAVNVVVQSYPWSKFLFSLHQTFNIQYHTQKQRNRVKFDSAQVEQNKHTVYVRGNSLKLITKHAQLSKMFKFLGTLILV